MIDLAQRSLYRLCEISPIDFWKYTPAESNLMIEVANDKEEFEYTKHAQLCCYMFNANGAEKKGGQSFTIEDFLPEEMIKTPAPMTLEEYYAKIRAANIAMGGDEIII